ncbi:MAG: esterase/lipase family protein, partial [Ardenticatenaceae bacterium]
MSEMRNAVRRVGWLLFVLLLVMPIVALRAAGQARAQGTENPPEPQIIPALANDIYFGAVPPDQPDGPVLVFVHGFGGTARLWWAQTPGGATNDMYALAYEAGYRTAFVQLGGEDGSQGNSHWENGERLSAQIEVIADHYEVDTVDVIGHSKGGVDAQTAIVHYDAAPLVRALVTLAAPHRGTELADLAYTFPINVVAEILGWHSDALYNMQTAIMEEFRSETDPLVAAQDTLYFSAGGMGEGPFPSGLWVGNLILEPYGPNDG